MKKRKIIEKIIMGAVIGGAIGSVVGGKESDQKDSEEIKEAFTSTTKKTKSIIGRVLGIFRRKSPKKIPHEDI